MLPGARPSREPAAVLRLLPVPERRPSLRVRGMSPPLFLAALLLLGARSPDGGEAASPARARVGEAVREAGVVGIGEPAVHEFVIENAGGSPLEVALVEASRGTAATVEPGTIPPGAAGRVRVVVDTERVAGPLVLPTVVRTSDPDQPRLTLELRVEVRPFLLVHPGHARYITVQKAREGTIPQTVGTVDGAPFRVVGVESPWPHLRVAFREARPEERQPGWEGSQWRVETTLAADAPVGPLSGDLVVVTDHPRQRRARVPVSGFVRPVFAVTPPAARLGDVDPARPGSLSLVVKNFAEEEIALTGASTTVAGIRAEIEPVQPGRSWRLRLRIAADALPGAFAGVIRLSTDSAHTPAIEVPLGGRIVAPPRE